MISGPPQAVAGPALSVVGAVALLCSTLPRWFSVIVEYPGDQVLRVYGVLALDRGSLHSYTALGWPFEVLTVLTGVVAALAAAYGSVVADRARGAAAVVVVCGLVALGVVIAAALTFAIANPRSDSLVIGSDLRLGPGAIAACLSALIILAGGLLTHRVVTYDR